MNHQGSLAADLPFARGAPERCGVSDFGGELSIVRSHEALEAIAAAWARLEAASPGAILFQGHAWARAVFAFEAARGNAQFDPVIATLCEQGELKAVLPLERLRTATRSVLVPLGHGFAQYSDVVLAAGVEPRAAVAKLLKAAIAAAPCDAVTFLKVRSDSALAAGMPATHLVTGATQSAPYVGLSGFPDFQGYFQTISAKTRKNMRNDRNRLERAGPVTHHVATGGAETAQLIARTVEGRAGRLKDQGLTSRAFSDSAFGDFCAHLPDQPEIELMALSLHHNGAPIAEQWGFVHNRRYYAYVASRDFAKAGESPGRLHLGEVIQACAQRGLIGADLMVPAMPYKMTWATSVVEVCDYALPVTPRGHLLLRLWDRTLRPLIKRVVLAMPRGPRGVLMRLAGQSF